MFEKKQLLIIVEHLINGDTSGKTILSIARETGISARDVSVCVSQYSELFVFPQSGRFVAINFNKVPETNWRTYVVTRTKRDKQHNRVLWLGFGVAIFSAVFLSLVSMVSLGF